MLQIYTKDFEIQCPLNREPGENYPKKLRNFPYQVGLFP